MNKGRLVDLKKSGEGPHVAKDFRYSLSLGNRLNKNALKNGTVRPYDIIVKYEIYNDYYEVFTSSPHVFIAGSGLGGPVFAAARKAGLNYIKVEAGYRNLGFPGSSVNLFNNSIRKQQIRHRFE
ncbi:hypothetical protein [Myroides odoratus]|uniref:hypothetical protein n=1 Tax=Myroides odoratus TaxID=256 RepID=UPI0039AFE787